MSSNIHDTNYNKNSSGRNNNSSHANNNRSNNRIILVIVIIVIVIIVGTAHGISAQLGNMGAVRAKVKAQTK